MNSELLNGIAGDDNREPGLCSEQHAEQLFPYRYMPAGDDAAVSRPVREGDPYCVFHFDILSGKDGVLFCALLTLRTKRGVLFGVFHKNFSNFFKTRPTDSCIALTGHFSISAISRYVLPEANSLRRLFCFSERER